APDRLGAIGTSYGGYSVAHVLEKAPDLWAVGVSIVGYFNWMTATTNERGYLQRYDRQKMGHPDTDADRFRKYSPIYFLDGLREPIDRLRIRLGAHRPDPDRLPAQRAESARDVDVMLVFQSPHETGRVDPRRRGEAAHRVREDRGRPDRRESELGQAGPQSSRDLRMSCEASLEAFLPQEFERPVKGVEQVRGNRGRGRMPVAPLPFVSVPGVQVQVPSLHGLRVRRFPERSGHRDRSDARGGGDALLGRREPSIDPELRERKREPAEGRDSVHDHERVRGMGGLDDRLEGICHPGRGLVVDHDDGLRRRLQRGP